MKLRNLIITLLLTVLGLTTASAQSLVLRHRDGTASVVRVTDSLRLHTAGTQISVISGAETRNYDNDDILSITYRKGRSDVNRDYKTDISDVVAVINDMAGSGMEQQAPSTTDADVNGDGKTDISDVVAVINVMAGQDNTPLPVVPAEDTDYYSETGNAFYIYRNDGDFNAFLRADADSISFRNGCQLVHTQDSTFAIPFAAIDSVSFIVKKPVLRDGLFFLNEYHAAHITAIDSLTLYFDSGIIADSLPHIGQVVLHGAYMPPFEEGFAGRAKSISLENNQIKVDCDMICIGDVYKRLILVGNAETVSDEEYAKYRKRKPQKIDWFSPVEEYGTTPMVTLPDMKFSFLHGLVSIESKKPRLNIHYTVYIDDWTYNVTATCRLHHDEFINKYSLKLGDLADIENDKTLDKEEKEIAAALKRLQNYESMSDKDWAQSLIDECKKKGDKEKLSDDEANAMKKMWDKLKFKYAVPIAGPIVFEFEIGPLLKPKGALDLSFTEKSTALSTFYVEARGNTMATLADPRLALATGVAHIGGYSKFRKDPPYSETISLTAKGSLSIGVIAKASVNLIHKSVLHATVIAQHGGKVAASLEAKLDSETVPDWGFYDALKDSKIKAEPFTTFGLELGVTPWSFLTASFEWELDHDEIGSVYLFPHFTKPALLDYDTEKRMWSNENFQNHLILCSQPSKNIIPLFPCKIGLRIVDEDGNMVRETDECLYFKDDPDYWKDLPLYIDLNGLEEGKTYRCYPVLRYFIKKMWRAAPSFEFTVPKKMTVNKTSVNVDVGNSREIYLSGGWGIYKITGGSNVVSAVFDRSFLSKRRSGGFKTPERIGGFIDAASIDGGGRLAKVFVNEKDEDGIDFPVHGLPVIIQGMSAGKTTITIEDMRSGYKQNVEVIVGGESNSALTLSTNSLDFGMVKAGESKSLWFTVTNNSTEGVTFTFGETQGDFSFAGSGKTFSLLPGSQRTFKVTFTATQSDVESAGELVITCGDGNGAQVITLTANNHDDIKQGKHIKVTPSSVDFGEVPVGLSNTAEFIVRNVGTENMSFTVEETHRDVDIFDSGKTFTLASGDEKSFVVAYRPTTVNTGFNLKTSIETDAEEGKQQVSFHGSAISPNYSKVELIYNGDFSLGAVGFTSDYDYVSAPGTHALYNESKYSVGTCPRNYHYDFKDNTDHTTGDGNMLIVNGSTNNSKYAWKQTVYVEKGKTYEFSAWFISVSGHGSAYKNDIEYNINGTSNLGTYDQTENGWERYYWKYTATETGPIELKIRTMSAAAGGNDFAIDDISFTRTTGGEDGKIVMERKYWIKHGTAYNYPEFTYHFDNNKTLTVGYFDSGYWDGSYSNSIVGIHIISASDGWFHHPEYRTKDWYIAPVVLEEWVSERVIISMDGNVKYYMNGELMGEEQFDLDLQNANSFTLQISSWGWWTGHRHYMDDFKLKTPVITLSDDFDDGVLDLSLWKEPVNPDGMREEDGIIKMEQLRTDEDFNMYSVDIPIR